jgi:hypothetical protein
LVHLQDGVIIYGRMGHHDELVDGRVAHHGGGTTRPTDYQFIDVCLQAETEVCDWLHLTLIATAAVNDL